MIVVMAFLICALIVACANSNVIDELTSTIETYIQTEFTTGATTEVLTTTQETVETKPIIFDPNITFTSEYIAGGEVMNHILYTPSTASNDTPMPLIVWLHGSGERYGGGGLLIQSGLPNVLNNWELEGFNAYVLCPHLTGKFGYSQWSSAGAAKSLGTLLDKFINEHNVDIDNVVVVGHSLGGQGALYMAHELPEYFSKCVVLSGYHPGINISEINIETIGYVGKANAGEDPSSINYMKNNFASAFGEDNFFVLQASHGGVPRAAFTEDKDSNGRSDIIEWMLQNTY